MTRHVTHPFPVCPSPRGPEHVGTVCVLKQEEVQVQKQPVGSCFNTYFVLGVCGGVASPRKNNLQLFLRGGGP